MAKLTFFTKNGKKFRDRNIYARNIIDPTFERQLDIEFRKNT